MFDNIIGQEQVARLFKNILKEERLAHLYLFVGPNGVGKFLFAKELARVLLCEKACPNGGSSGRRSACGECKACKQVGHLTHPDLRIIETVKREKNIPIERVREMEREIGLKPFYGSYKIFIINDADLLSEAAANALLKTLEEPPPYSLIILVSARPEALLPTVYSRAQVIRFHPIRTDLLVPLMQEKFKLGKPEAGVLAGLCGGSLGWGSYLVENNFLAQREVLLNKLVNCFKAKTEQARFESVSLLGDEVISYARRNSKETTDVRAKIIQQFKIISLFLRDILLWSNGLKERLLNQDKITEFEKIDVQPDFLKMTKSLERLLVSEGYIRANANINLVVADALFNVVA